MLQDIKIGHMDGATGQSRINVMASEIDHHNALGIQACGMFGNGKNRLAHIHRAHDRFCFWKHVAQLVELHHPYALRLLPTHCGCIAEVGPVAVAAARE